MLCFSVQYQEGQKRRKPNYSSVDLSEVEWEDKDDIVCVIKTCCQVAIILSINTKSWPCLDLKYDTLA